MSARMARPLERFAWITLILVPTGGTAYALDGHNTVFSDDIVNGEVTTADIGDGAVRSVDVANDSTAFALRRVDVKDNSLTGAGVDESTLGQVPDAFSATVGGIGRSSAGTGCNPSDANPSPARRSA